MGRNERSGHSFCPSASSPLSHPPWTGPGREPTLYAVQAALHAASLLDDSGSHAADARASYWNHAVGGSFSPSDLYTGERLLVACRLVVEDQGRLFPTSTLRELLNGTFEDAVTILSTLALRQLYDGVDAAAGSPSELDHEVAHLIPDPARRELALLALGKHFDDQHRRLLGEIGEEVVLEAVRGELDALGYPDLARAARRLSILSDQLGYDISAPRIRGAPRLIEVKATRVPPEVTVGIYLSRNESDTGRRFSDWSLVVCQILDANQRRGSIIGFCNAAALTDLLPADSESARWEQAEIDLPTSRLTPGWPRPA